MADSTDGEAAVDLLRQYQQAALGRINANGRLHIGSGTFNVDDHAISFAIDPGCETFNDDFVAVWQPAYAGDVFWAAAIADGVTGSLLAQEAAELACYFGLSAIAKANPDRSAIAKNPIAFVTRLFHLMGRRVQSAPDDFRPPNCPSSIWKLAIREGKYLQTTLTLVWSTADGLCIMAIGDGGILYSYESDPKRFTSHTFGSGKLQCLGPRSAPVQPEAYLLENWSGIACFTDGLAEAIEGRSDFPTMMFDRQENIASAIDFLNRDCPELVNDNLSAFRAMKV